MVPVADLLGQPVLDRRLGLGDQLELAVADLVQVLRHHVRDGVALGLLLQLARDPGALRPGENRIDAGFVVGQSGR